jgi:heterodisulfide reductase subunit C
MEHRIQGGAMKTIDPEFKREVAGCPGGEHIMRCFACGTCVLSCPVSEVTADYSPRRIIHMILLGMKDEVLGSGAIWYCMSCYRCHVRCPQDVKYPEIMRVLRKLAVEQGYVKPGFITAVNEVDIAAQEIRRDMLKRIIEKRDSITQEEIAEIRNYSKTRLGKHE